MECHYRKIEVFAEKIEMFRLVNVRTKLLMIYECKLYNSAFTIIILLSPQWSYKYMLHHVSILYGYNVLDFKWQCCGADLDCPKKDPWMLLTFDNLATSRVIFIVILFLSGRQGPSKNNSFINNLNTDTEIRYFDWLLETYY